MSAGPLCPWAFHTTAESLNRTHQLIDELGIKWSDPDSILEALYDVPARDMLVATSHIAVGDSELSKPPKNPALVLTRQPMTILFFNRISHHSLRRSKTNPFQNHFWQSALSINISVETLTKFHRLLDTKNKKQFPSPHVRFTSDWFILVRLWV